MQAFLIQPPAPAARLHMAGRPCHRAATANRPLPLVRMAALAVLPVCLQAQPANPPPALAIAGDPAGGMVILSWWSEYGASSRIETSADLVHWLPHPLIHFAAGAPVLQALPTGPRKAFFRVRYAADGDLDGDGLPDAWEIAMLGTLAFAAQDDPDGDGLGNLLEYVLGAHPLAADHPALELSVHTPLR